MKHVYAAAVVAATLVMAAGPEYARGASTVGPPRFTSEPMSEFQAAFARHIRGALDRSHSDGAKYHAFRFLHQGTVIVGIAKSITVDSTGQVHVVGEPGTVTYAHRATSATEYSHILVPLSVTPP
jgi:hypothetical protein